MSDRPGLKRSTLQARMKKLGIGKDDWLREPDDTVFRLQCNRTNHDSSRVANDHRNLLAARYTADWRP